MIENPLWAVCQRWADRERRQVIEPFRLDCCTSERAKEKDAGNGWIGVTDQRIWLNGLPQAFGGLRVLQLSDIHHSLFFPLDRVAQAVELANSLNPDLVALTGDFITYSRRSIGPVTEMLGTLRSRLGVVAVLGNHDFRVGADMVARALRRQRIKVLRNRHVVLRDGGEALHVAGVDDLGYGADLSAALHGVPDGAPTILLAHNPRLVRRAARHGVGLILSGHTHGGQVNLPLLGSVYGRSPEQLRYKIGWDRLGGTQIYVSRGIGTIVLPWRLRCPAEIPCLELQPHRVQPAESTVQPADDFVGRSLNAPVFPISVC
jgi:predicted MPP superfamily phosphohydrolase